MNNVSVNYSHTNYTHLSLLQTHTFKKLNMQRGCWNCGHPGPSVLME